VEGSITERKCDGFSKFAALFSVIENIVVKLTPQKHQNKKWNFYGFFCEEMWWC
jgi:hypothetical protein